jgi:hypothetical protein
MHLSTPRVPGLIVNLELFILPQQGWVRGVQVGANMHMQLAWLVHESVFGALDFHMAFRPLPVSSSLYNHAAPLKDDHAIE